LISRSPQVEPLRHRWQPFPQLLCGEREGSERLAGAAACGEREERGEARLGSNSLTREALLPVPILIPAKLSGGMRAARGWEEAGTGGSV
jgi:hypothetical protein